MCTQSVNEIERKGKVISWLYVYVLSDRDKCLDCGINCIY